MVPWLPRPARRETRSDQPLGQDPPIGPAATTWPDDLDFLVRQLLDVDSVGPDGGLTMPGLVRTDHALHLLAERR